MGSALLPNVAEELLLNDGREEDDFVALKRGMLDHEVECLSHAFLHCIWFHDDVWLPDHATFLPEKCRRVSVMGFLMRLAADTRMVWGSCILDLAQVLALERSEPLRSHGILVGVVACLNQDIIQTGEGRQEHTEGTFSEGRGSSRFDQ